MEIAQSIQDKLLLARSLAQSSGEMALQLRDKTPKDEFISEKAQQDFLTVADTQVQQAWYDAINKQYPKDVILAEEDNTPTPISYDLQLDKDKGLWVIDPIDGTANFMRGLPEWGISIAYICDGDVQFSVIHLPELNQMLWAVKGQGAFLSTGEIPYHAIHVSSETNHNRSTIILSRSNRWDIQDHLAYIAQLEEKGIDYRLFGSAAYSLACVAQGQAEGYFEPHLKPWDIAAGLLLVQEAGGVVQSPPLSKIIKSGGTIFAHNGKIPLAEMVA